MNRKTLLLFGSVTLAAILIGVGLGVFLSTNPTGDPSKKSGPKTVSYSNEVDPNWYKSSDLIVWIASDSQPNEDEKRYNDFKRFRNTIEDLNELPFQPNYTVLVGDLTDADNAKKPKRNIQRTRRIYGQLKWFESHSPDKTLIIMGNHENEYPNFYRRSFGDQCTPTKDRLLTMGTDSNVSFVGPCGLAWDWFVQEEGEEPFHPLRKYLRNQKNEKKNIFVTLHQPFKNLVSNCHSRRNSNIYYTGKAFRNQYLSLVNQYSNLITGTVMGHLHGRHENPGRSAVHFGENTAFLSPVLGNRVKTSPNGNSCRTKMGVGDSLFLSFREGATQANAYIRHSCNDPDKDGECEENGYWARSFSIPLEHPFETN